MRKLEGLPMHTSSQHTRIMVQRVARKVVGGRAIFSEKKENYAMDVMISLE